MYVGDAGCRWLGQVAVGGLELRPASAAPLDVVGPLRELEYKGGRWHYPRIYAGSNKAK